jgi:hypothetical protein
MNENKSPDLMKVDAIAELTKPGAEFEVGVKLINGARYQLMVHSGWTSLCNKLYSA